MFHLLFKFFFLNNTSNFWVPYLNDFLFVRFFLIFIIKGIEPEMLEDIFICNTLLSLILIFYHTFLLHA